MIPGFSKPDRDGAGSGHYDLAIYSPVGMEVRDHLAEITTTLYDVAMERKSPHGGCHVVEGARFRGYSACIAFNGPLIVLNYDNRHVYISEVRPLTALVVHHSLLQNKLYNKIFTWCWFVVWQVAGPAP
jgi:hypothetical protein